MLCFTLTLRLLVYPRRYRLGLIEALIVNQRVSGSVPDIRGVIASASLKHFCIHFHFSCPAKYPRRYRLGLIEAPSDHHLLSG